MKEVVPGLKDHGLSSLPLNTILVSYFRMKSKPRMDGCFKLRSITKSWFRFWVPGLLGNLWAKVQWQVNWRLENLEMWWLFIMGTSLVLTMRLLDLLKNMHGTTVLIAPGPGIQLGWSVTGISQNRNGLLLLTPACKILKPDQEVTSASICYLISN